MKLLPTFLLTARLAATSLTVTFPAQAQSQETPASETAEAESLSLSKPLWTNKGYPAVESIVELEKLFHIARENDEAAVEKLFVRGDVFLTDGGTAVFLEDSGYLRISCQVRVKGTLGEIWLPKPALTNIPPPPPPPLPPPLPSSVTLTTAPLTKVWQEKLAAERAREAKQQRELFKKQEAAREANGDYSQAPGMTPEQKEVAAAKWAETDAAKSITGGTPYPH